MTEDICGATAKSTGEPCQRPAGWGTDSSEGRCKFHGGSTPSKDENPDVGAEEGNGNATTHNAHRKPEFLKSDIVDTRHEDTYTAAHEALCSRYERVHGREPDYALKKDLEEVALAYVKRDLIDVYARENAADGSPLVEEQVIGQDEQDRPVRVKQTNKLQSLWSDLRRETRLLLKDMGLYESPEKKQADAVENLATVLSETES